MIVPNTEKQLPYLLVVCRNYLLHSLLKELKMCTVYKMVVVEEMAAETVCEQCVEGGKAVGFCHHCAEFICNDCTHTHQLLKVFA